MGKQTAGHSLRILAVAAFLLMGSGLARAGDFDGAWTMNANGWTFQLKIEEKDGVFTGTMRGINNDQTSTIEGKIQGHEITFTRDNGQTYCGYLLYDDPTGKTTKLGMAGIFQAGQISAGWFATR